jgi:transcriptional regulator with XRE-family HTH domain
MTRYFGRQLKVMRIRKGWTLEFVARKIGSHKGYISGIENGKVNPPSMKFLRKIAKLFRISLRTTALSAYIEKAPKIIRRDVLDAFDYSHIG